MGSVLISNAQIVLRDRILYGHSVYISGNKIEKILPSADAGLIEADEVVDAAGMYLAPGYIDLHIHGVRKLLADRGVGEIEEICGIIPQYGVTGFLPTLTPTISEDEDIELLNSLSGINSKGANILGFFLEGHFLSLTGALSGRVLKKSAKTINKLMEAAKPYKIVFGISPEVDGICELIPVMTQNGYPAFITHTMATVEQTEAAIRAGATHATHFYDVFPYPGEKDPGVRTCGAVEAVLANTETSVDFILDGEHVHPAAVKMALACKGKDKVCLITDSNVNAGLPPGKYHGFGDYGIEVFYEGGPARMDNESRTPGALAGSGLTMDRAVRNAVKMLGVDIPQAVAMASSNPSRVLGLQNRKGFIKESYDADMVLLNNDLEVVRCWICGECCFIKST